VHCCSVIPLARLTVRRTFHPFSWIGWLASAYTPTSSTSCDAQHTNLPPHIVSELHIPSLQQHRYILGMLQNASVPQQPMQRYADIEKTSLRCGAPLPPPPHRSPNHHHNKCWPVLALAHRCAAYLLLRQIKSYHKDVQVNKVHKNAGAMDTRLS